MATNTITGAHQDRYVAERAPAGCWVIRDLWYHEMSAAARKTQEEYPAVGLSETDARAWIAQKDSECLAEYTRDNPADDCECGCEGDIECHRG